jgi:hypothetical protein
MQTFTGSNTPFQDLLLNSFSFLEENAVYSVYIIFIKHNLLLFHHCRVGNCSVINSALFPIYMNVYDPSHIKFQIPGFQGQVVFVTVILKDKNEIVCIMTMFYIIQ